MQERIREEQAAIDAHKRVGSQVRQAIKDISGTMPENYPREENLKKLAAARKKELKAKSKVDGEA